MSDYETLRQKALERRRRLIYDNDGCDVYQCKSPSPSELLSKRTIPLCGSHADTLFCTTRSSGFGLFTHNTKIGQIFTGREGKHEYNITEELIKQGKDYLQIMTDFCRKNNIEIFWSMRMNDVHDSGTTLGRPEAFRLNKIKTEHPEYLFGSRENPPKYGAWSGVDYTREEIRELAYAFVEEVCSNYDIDGINLDFFRHPVFFKRTAWGLPIQQYELDLMTDLMRKIRKMTIEIGKERGRPILLSSRVPDSLEYSRTIGIDLETWLKEGLIDMMVVSGYIQLNFWEYSAAIAHKYGVKAYASLDESRVKDKKARELRSSTEAYRGRAMNAWNAGMDGICLFNYRDMGNTILKEIGEREILEKLDKFYFTSVRGEGEIAWGGIPHQEFINIPTLNPGHPLSIKPGENSKIFLPVGEDFSHSARDGIYPGIKMYIEYEAPSNINTKAITVKLNGNIMRVDIINERTLEYNVPGSYVKQGMNEVEISVEGSISSPCIISDLYVLIKYSE